MNLLLPLANVNAIIHNLILIVVMYLVSPSYIPQIIMANIGTPNTGTARIMRFALSIMMDTIREIWLKKGDQEFMRSMTAF